MGRRLACDGQLLGGGDAAEDADDVAGQGSERGPVFQALVDDSLETAQIVAEGARGGRGRGEDLQPECAAREDGLVEIGGLEACQYRAGVGDESDDHRPELGGLGEQAADVPAVDTGELGDDGDQDTQEGLGKEERLHDGGRVVSKAMRPPVARFGRGRRPRLQSRAELPFERRATRVGLRLVLAHQAATAVLTPEKPQKTVAKSIRPQFSVAKQHRPKRQSNETTNIR